jgi:folate-dependent phosphoribosylglycinamide formyltransferase PurN
VIFLFANEGYGWPFVTAVRRYAQEGDVAVTVVISSRNIGRRRGRLRQAAVAWWLLRHVGFVLPIVVDRRCRIRVVKDVNSDAFGKRIASSDVGVIAGFNQIFRAPIRTRFARLVNAHPSLLPFYRGPVP